MNRWLQYRRAARAIAARIHPVALVVFVALEFTGCGTNQPLGPQIVPDVKSRMASFDGNQQNSGILGVESGRFRVTSHFHDRYLALAARYGQRFTPALDTARGVTSEPDGAFLFDAEAMQDFLRMNQRRRDEAASAPERSILKRAGL